MRQTKGMRQPIASKVARKRPASRRATRRDPPAPVVDMSPAQYIVRSTAPRRSSPRPDRPDELLVHAHRDQHPVEVAAQFLASRLIRSRATRAWSRSA